MRLTVADLVELFIDTQEVEIYSCDKHETVFEGWSDEIPEEYEDCDVESIAAHKRIMEINISEE